MKKMIGVVGAGDAPRETLELAYRVGVEIAQRNWILVTGGLGGVMEAASKGASDNGGIVVGILPTATSKPANLYVTIPIVTNMGHARNVVIAHTADAIVAVGGEYGTLSEIAVAKKLGKRVIGIKSWDIKGVEAKESPEEAIAALEDC